MSKPLPFRALKPFLKESFGRPMYRVALDAGSSCPNRDGTKGFGGCTYCDVEGSGTGALSEGTELAEQLRVGLKRIARRHKKNEAPVGAIAYFQSYSNTYVERERLAEVLDVVTPFLGDTVHAVSVATRPDCLPDAAIDELRKLAAKVPVWVELGLESASDQVLLDINRLHTLAEFEDAVARSHAAGLSTVGHAILGLPGDGRDGARRTAEALARAGCAGVKVHNLMVLRRTQMAAQWKRGELEVLEPPTYVEWLADFIERLNPDQVLHRITGESPKGEQLAPRWDVYKTEIRERLVATLEARGTRQGSHHPTQQAS